MCCAELGHVLVTGRRVEHGRGHGEQPGVDRDLRPPQRFLGLAQQPLDPRIDDGVELAGLGGVGDQIDSAATVPVICSPVIR